MTLLPLTDGLTRFLVDGLHAGHFALVVQLASSRQCEFTFQPSILQIEAKGYQRQSFFRGFSNELADLCAI